MIAYKIRDWDKHFEKADTRRCVSMRWVPVPTKQDGKGYRRVAKHERSVELFCAWCLILQIAAKMPERGLLVDDGHPLDADDLSVMTGFPIEIFELALQTLVDKKFRWIEEVNTGS